MTPEKEVNGRITERKFLPLRKTKEEVYEISLDQWEYDYRIKIITVVSSSGECRPMLFVMKGTKLRFEKVVKDGVVTTRVYAHTLLRILVLAT